jgi:hypothetical protein
VLSDVSRTFYSVKIRASKSSVAPEASGATDGGDKKSASRKDGTQGCKVYFKVDVKRRQMKNRTEGIVDEDDPAHSAITTGDASGREKFQPLRTATGSR